MIKIGVDFSLLERQPPVISDTIGMAARPSPFSDGNFLPFWHQSPLVVTNYDSYSTKGTAEASKHAFSTQSIRIEERFKNIIFRGDSREEKAEVKGSQAWASALLPPGEKVDETFLSIQYPIFDSLSSVRLDRTKAHRPVAILSSPIYVREFLRNLLPEKSRGIIVVFSNPCYEEEVFTFRVDGSTATFLDVGDSHSPQYNRFNRTRTLSQLEHRHSQMRTSLSVAKDFCDKVVTMYPSNDMEQEYNDDKPIVFMSIAASIFIFTSLVFTLYDALVAHRQRLVMGRALASGAIVSSLFPKSIRDQMYEENEVKQKQVESSKKHNAFLTSGTPDLPVVGRPMADVFEQTTSVLLIFAGLPNGAPIVPPSMSLYCWRPFIVPLTR